MRRVGVGAGGSGAPAPGRPRRLVALVVVAGVVVAATVLAVAARSRRDAASVDSVGVVHVHGLGVNPKDGSLYVATHTGLFRIDNGRAHRVGNSYQDTMGFTVVGPDHFLGGGHPDLRDERLRRPGRPPLLGLIESTDAGITWNPRSLLGEADFHGIALVGGTVYAYDVTSGRLMTSVDKSQWEVRSTVGLRSFAVSPDGADVLLGAGERSLLRSTDGGRTWSAAPGPPLALVSWAPDRVLWGATGEGGVYSSVDRGSTWNRAGDLPGEPEAFLADQAALYAAVHEKGIFRSRDGGRSWELLYREGRVS